MIETTWEQFDRALHEEAIESLERKILDLALERTRAQHGAVFLVDPKTSGLRVDFHVVQGVAVPLGDVILRRRTDGRANGIGIREAGTVTELQVTGRAGVPDSASAVVLNVTVTEAEAPGFITVFPCGAERPNAANLNYVAGSTIPNAVIAKIGTGGKVCLFTLANTHMTADVNGYHVT